MFITATNLNALTVKQDYTKARLERRPRRRGSQAGHAELMRTHGVKSTFGPTQHPRKSYQLTDALRRGKT